MAEKAVDEATIHAALDTLHGLYSPYHPMIAGWGSYMYPNGAWDPDHHVPDMITQEITDAHKQLGYIRGLEAKLKGKDPNSGQDTLDWEMLSRMKKDLGMKVDFKTETEKREEQRAKLAGWDGKVPTPQERALKDLTDRMTTLPDAQKQAILDAAKIISGSDKKDEKKEETKEEKKK